MTDTSGSTSGVAGNLLILDDDELVGLLIETVGRRAGMATRRVAAPAAFFAELSAAPATHVVLDLTMPEMSGEEVLHQLAQVRSRARVIVCSGADAERLAAAMALAGALGLVCAGALPKPFSPVVLRRLLTAA